MKGWKRLMTLSLVVALVIAFVPALSGGEEAEKININKASMEELTKLTGLSPENAECIVKYREEHGPFKQSEDIMNVKGIGPDTLKAIQDKITTTTE